MTHPSIADLEAGLDTIRAAPRDTGVVELIVRRPAEGRGRDSMSDSSIRTAGSLVTHGPVAIVTEPTIS